MKKLSILILCLISTLLIHAEIPQEVVTRNLMKDQYPDYTYDEYLKTETGNATNIELINSRKESRFNTVLIIVEPELYPQIEESLDTYLADITIDGWDYFLITYSGDSIVELKDVISDYYDNENIDGTFMIGDLPAAWYEMHEDFDNDGIPDGDLVQFPIDLYFMDLDGVWIDMDENGLLDYHVENLHPEIWLGRIKADNLNYINYSEAEMINLYFNRNHMYRIGALQPATEGLAYIDDDWSGWGTYYQEQLALAIDNVELINDVNATNRDDYRDVRLTNIYKFIQVHVHSSPAAHFFYENNGATHYQMTNTELVNIPARSYFYNLFCCSNANYEAPNNMGSLYLLSNDYGLGVIGSTKTGSMLTFENFYQPLSEDMTFGQSMKEWWSTTVDTDPSQEGWQRSWFYGMTFLGDPVLQVKPDTDNCVYVDISNTGTQDGTYANPYQSIQTAIDSAIDGDIVWVKDGLYSENLVITDKQLQLRSIDGPGNCIIEPATNSSIINWQGSESTVTIAGFTLQNSISDNVDGSVFNLVDVEVLIENCIIQDNQVTNYSMIFSDSDLTLSQCRISNNNCDTASLIVNHGNHLKILNSNVNNNITNADAYIIEKSAGYLTIDFSYISNNNLNESNLMSISSTDEVIITNSLISDNITSDNSSTFLINSDGTTLRNNTIANNSIEVFNVTGDLNLFNNIFWDESGNQTITCNGLVTADYNLTGFPITGTAILHVDPLFEDSENGDYHLSVYSPAIGAGSIDYSSEVDIERSPRPYPIGSNPDLGAFENSLDTAVLEVIYVADSGSDETGSGAESSPYQSICKALDELYPGSKIIVEPGIYNENIVIPDKEMTISSRFVEDHNFEDIENTVISGMETESVINISNLNSTVKIEGFTILDGSANAGGGIHINAATVELSNMIIKDNNASLGGGIFMSNSTTLLRNLTIVNNNATILGGGIYSPTINESNYIVNSIIYNNTGNYEILNNPNLFYCLTTEDTGGESNIFGDPIFLNEEFWLQSDSPCIDAGTLQFSDIDPFEIDIQASEFAGASRDIGCMEYGNTLAEDAEMPDRTVVSLYPNPFNPTITISYNLAENDALKDIKIYNLKGQIVKIFSADEIDNSLQCVTWDGVDKNGQSVATGLYFFKITTRDQSIMKKSTLIK